MTEGSTFPDFAMLCARAFGACVMLRDEPLDAPIPEFQPSDYNAKAKAEAVKKMQDLAVMPDSERIEYGKTRRAEAIASAEEWLAREKAGNERLEKMRKEVSAWQPPTPDHEGLKRFMLEQIDTSVNSLEYIKDHLRSKKSKTPMDYYRDDFAEAERSIEYHTKGDAEERERTASRNKWVADLRSSLEEPASMG